MGGDGFAIWYTKEKMEQGEVLGMRDGWTGLGVLFDTSDPVKQRRTPEIFSIFNDGTKYVAGHEQQFATGVHCFRDYRNLGIKVWARLTYANKKLRLDIDMKGGRKNYMECFTLDNVPDLPTGYYFGVTAQTSGTRGSDDHDIYAFETSELYPAKVAEVGALKTFFQTINGVAEILSLPSNSSLSAHTKPSTKQKANNSNSTRK